MEFAKTARGRPQADDSYLPQAAVSACASKQGGAMRGDLILQQVCQVLAIVLLSPLLRGFIATLEEKVPRGQAPQHLSALPRSVQAVPQRNRVFHSARRGVRAASPSFEHSRRDRQTSRGRISSVESGLSFSGLRLVARQFFHRQHSGCVA
jgi:hypothetical protein